MSKIIACRINECEGGLGHSHQIEVTLEGSVTPIAILTFYCDEKAYEASSFVGMSLEAAEARVFDDDRRYMLSTSKWMRF